LSQNLILKNKGLFTNSNQLSQVPEGALSLAKNVVIDKDGVAEPCRGFDRLLNPASSILVRNDRAVVYQDYLIARMSDSDTMAYKVPGVGWTAYSGTVLHPDQNYARMQFSQANGNLYFTTSTGVKVLESYAGPIYSTGMPRGLDGVGSTTGASGMMATNTQVAYRILWGSRDVNSNLYLGTPSQRIIVANASGGTRDVSLTFTIPSGVTTSDFFQVYRSKESATSSDEPNDELQLVYEKNPTAGEITAKSVTFTDSTPISLMGASLYTNASQEGIQQANDEPPFAKDICEFKNYTFFLNVKTKHRLNVKLLAVSGTGLAVNDTITINSVVFTAKASEAIASGEFKVSTGGSAAQNISDTAQSLVKVINQYASNTTIYAYYLSGYQDLPGQILLIKRTLDDTSFAVTRSNAVAFDIGTGTSANDNYANGLMWSKGQQPEHVPTTNLEYVGSKNFQGRRILALRDSLFILKDDGVFRLTGSGGSWSINPLDTSTHIIAPDSAVVVNNQIFALCDQGIVTISDVGVQVISRPIEDQIQALISANYTNLKTMSFGVSYETDRKYYLWTISSSSDNYPTQAFVYNTFTQAWTTRVKDAKHAIVNLTDDKIYICNPSDKHILQERKSLTFRDYIDEEVDGFTVSSSSSKSVVLNTTVGLDIGYLLYSSSTVYSMITAVDPATNTVTVNDVKVWPAGTVTVYKVIDSEVEYTAQHFDNPGVMKHFQECALLLREASFINGFLSFFTDISGGYSNTSIAGRFGSNLWGLFSWGSGTWGGVTRQKPIRCFVPREKSRGTLLSVKFRVANAYSKWSLNGVSLNYEWVSERSGRS
jgi:hypothetical protein